MWKRKRFKSAKHTVLPPTDEKLPVILGGVRDRQHPNLEFSSQWENLTSATTVDGATSSAVHWRSTKNAVTTICRMSAWRLPGRS